MFRKTDCVVTDPAFHKNLAMICHNKTKQGDVEAAFCLRFQKINKVLWPILLNAHLNIYRKKIFFYKNTI